MVKNAKRNLASEDPLAAKQALEDATRRAVENASTQQLLELIRIKHAMQSNPGTAAAELRAAYRRRAH